MKLAPPAGAFCRITSAWNATSGDESPSAARVVTPAAAVSRPVPLATVAFAADPATVQAPPRSALPHPQVVARAKASLASAVGVAVTATGRVTAPVAPALSVTVSFTL